MIVLHTGSISSTVVAPCGVALVLAVCCSVPLAAGQQDPPAGSLPAAVPPASRPIDAFRFDNDAGAIFWVVKPDQTESFELVWSVVRARLAGSPRPDLKTLANTLKVFKLAPQPGDQDVTYLFLADPASRSASYSTVSFLYELGLFERAEADEIFKMLEAAVVRGNPFSLAGIP